jgi:tRNA(Ile)-lysidine synthase
MTDRSNDVLEILASGLADRGGAFVVALSGGADSSVLLAAMVELRARLPGAAPAAVAAPCWTLRAVHVDHGLQPAAATFREDCARLCARLEVPLEVLRVTVAVDAGASLEAAARDARYAALAAHLGAHECLLTAHHAEDQAETLLLQALRGAGLKGLCAMPIERRLGSGRHLRPLLAVPRRALARFAAARGIRTGIDPMNADTRFDRVFLRREVWPALAARWPAAGMALARTAAHLAEAQELLEALAAHDLTRLRDGHAVSIPTLRQLSPTRRINALRRWIDAAGVPVPPTARLKEALRQILAAEPDHQPCIGWHAHALRRYRDRVYLTAADPPRLARERHWSIAADAVLELGEGLGRLKCTPRRGGLQGLPATLRVCARAGGERLRPGPQAATQTVQHLCQSLGVVPWMRQALPFIYADDALVAVGDLWFDARFAGSADVIGMGFEWLGAPLLV